MLEFMLVFYLANRVADIVENKGYGGTLWRVLFVVAWIGAEILGLAFGMVMRSAAGLEPFGASVVGYALLFALLAGGMVFLVALVLPTHGPTRSGSYMDDYHEYQRTGRIRDRRDRDRDSHDDGYEDDDDYRDRRRRPRDRDNDRDRDRDDDRYRPRRRRYRDDY